MSPTRRTERRSDAPTAHPLVTAPAERAALGRTVLGLMRMHESRGADFDGPEHWPSDARPSGTAESRERLAHTEEREGWVAWDASQTALARDVAAYTRALRDGGMGARHVLAAVSVVVREAAAPSLAADSLDAIVHDAGRCCVQAYFAA